MPTNNDLLELIPKLRKLNEFLEKNYPTVSFVDKLIELNQKLISQNERIKSIEGEEIPEDLLNLTTEISKMRDAVEKTICGEDPLEKLLFFTGIMENRNHFEK